MPLRFDQPPYPLPESQPFWDGIEKEQLLIQRCGTCGEFYFPPAPVCPKCTSRDVSWTEASGKATLYSYVIVQQPSPLWGQEGPMSAALVRLEEGPSLVSTIVDCPQTPAHLQLDAQLQATFKHYGEDQKMLCFRLTQSLRDKN